MQNILLISLGAIIGANLRYFIAVYLCRLLPSPFPLPTLIINISASFALGFFLAWAGERVLVDERWRIVFVVGFCATYSTYSSYAFETVGLFEKGQWALSVLNIFSTNILCFISVVLGAIVARSR